MARELLVEARGNYFLDRGWSPGLSHWELRVVSTGGPPGSLPWTLLVSVPPLNSNPRPLMLVCQRPLSSFH